MGLMLQYLNNLSQAIDRVEKVEYIAVTVGGWTIRSADKDSKLRIALRKKTTDENLFLI